MDIASIKETNSFSRLLDSLSVQSQPITGQPTANEEQPAELLEELEGVIRALEQLPQEELSDEQQDVLAAILQTLTLQTEELESADASSFIKAGLDPVSEEAPTVSGTSHSQQARAVLQGKDGNNELIQEKISVLLQQIDQKIEGLSAEVPEEGEQGKKLLGLAGETIPADAKKMEQLFKQLADFIRQFDFEEFSEGKGTSFKQLEQVLQRLEGTASELENGMPEKEMAQFNTQVTETGRTGQSNIAAFQQPESAGLQAEAVQKVEQSPVPSGAPQEAAKAAFISRPESAPPTAHVRMSNLIADLSDVFRGSMRITGSGDSAQIKVSIFPEHLGHLDIRLTTTDGKIAAQIFTSNALAKEALELQVNQLRTVLMQQGLAVDRIEITQQSSQQSFGQQNGQSDQQFSQQQKQGTGLQKNGYQVIEDETAALEHIGSSGGAMMKVDYTI